MAVAGYRAPMTKSQTSILAIHPGALGDVILFGHLLAALRPSAGESTPSQQAGPHSCSSSATSAALRLETTITLVAGGAKARLLAGAGVVDAAADFDGLPIHELFSDTPLDQCRLPAMLGRCGRIVSCFVDADCPPARRLMRMCGAGDLTALPIRPPLGYPGHLTDLWRQRLGLAGKLQPATWTIPPAWRQAAARALKELGIDVTSRIGRRYVVIHPGAGAPDKCWAIQRFLDVAASLGSTGMGVVFAIGPVELERWPGQQIAHLGRAGAVLADPPLTELAGVLAGAAAYVGNDSGVSHLAAAVGAPAVVLFGPTSPTRFAPLGRGVTCLSNDTMDDILTSWVIDAVAKVCGA